MLYEVITDALVTIRSEAGGVDAADFASMLLRMYLRWAEKRGMKSEITELSAGEVGGHFQRVNLLWRGAGPSYNFV